jgi:alpha-ribazole phosphatase
MELTLVRHGVTRWNAERRFQGSTDMPLSEEGYAQARALAQRLARERPDRIYSSALQRAHTTAQIIAEPHGLVVGTDARLREFSFGRWEGLTWAEILAAQPDAAAGGWRDAARYEPEEGERFDAVHARIASFFAELVRAPFARAIIVTHAGTLHAALRALGVAADPRVEGVSFLPTSITRIAIEGHRAHLVTLNDIEHLDS